MELVGWTATFPFCPSWRQRQKGMGGLFKKKNFNLSPKDVKACIDVIDVDFTILSGQLDKLMELVEVISASTYFGHYLI